MKRLVGKGIQVIGMWQQVRSGDWLSRDRLLAYAVIVLIASLIACLAWTVLADERLIDRLGKPIGTDFSNVWAAGSLVLERKPAAPYEPALQHAAEQRAFDGRNVPFFGWHYPPLFLLVAAGLALLPYGFALLVWVALTLTAYVLVIRAIVPRPEAILVALAFPAVLVNLGHGQNGFLTAALLGGGLLLLERRPLLAGLLLGLLAYKPQFGVVIPLALAAGAHWRAFAAAAVTVVVACAATLLLLGPSVWIAFVDSLTFTRVVVLEAGDTGWPKIQSLFAALRMWGVGIAAAYGAQASLALAVAITTAWLWHAPLAKELKAAALPCACLLTTPYVLDYDLVVLAVSIAFLARLGLACGFHAFEITILALAWAMPLLARSLAAATGVPLGLLTVLLLYGAILQRAGLPSRLIPQLAARATAPRRAH
jgi:hypothetical protein